MVNTLRKYVTEETERLEEIKKHVEDYRAHNQEVETHETRTNETSGVRRRSKVISVSLIDKFLSKFNPPGTQGSSAVFGQPRQFLPSDKEVHH